MRKIFLLVMVLAAAVGATDYFGNNTNAANWENNLSGAGFAIADSVGYTCPGTGSFDVTSIGAQIKSAGAGGGNFRCAIYSVSRSTLIAEHSAQISVLSTWNTATWRGESQGVTQNATLTGGTKYLLVVTYDAADVLPGWSDYSGSNRAGYGSADHTGGFPAPFASSYNSYQVNWSIRVGVDAASGSPPIISAAATSIDTIGKSVSRTHTNTGDAATSWSCSALPRGYVFSTSTGDITGTPDTAKAKTGYQIIATNADGADTAFDTITSVVGIPTKSGSSWTCRSVNQDNVQAAIDSSADGDTIKIPTGSATFHSRAGTSAAQKAPVFIDNKRLFVRGAGSASTIINCKLGAISYDDYGILCQTNTKPISFAKLSVLDSVGSNGFFRIEKTASKTTPTYGIKIDSINFHSFATGTMNGLFLSVVGLNYGCASACSVVTHNANGSIQFLVGTYSQDETNTPPDYVGRKTWNLKSPEGDLEKFFVERCYFNYDTANYNSNVVDGNGGFSFCVRNCTIIGSTIESHSSCTAGYRGIKNWEIYNNAFVDPVSFAIKMRGGSGVIYGNSFDKTVGDYTDYTVIVDHQRTDSATAFECTNGLNEWCNGLSSLDGNDSLHGYPCLDQIGIDSGDIGAQRRAPVYVWNNTRNSTAFDTVYLNVGLGDTLDQKEHIAKNRDYFQSEKTAYTSYLYPHPLTIDCQTATLSYSAAIVCTVGVAIITQTATKGGTIYRVESVGVFPAGLSIIDTGASAGNISGTPGSATAKTAYAIRAVSCYDTVVSYDTITIIDTSTVPVPRPKSSARCTVDTYIDFESGSSGDLLTASILNGGDHGPAVTWSIDPSPMVDFFVWGLAEKELPGRVVVPTVGTFLDTAGLRGIKFDHSDVAARTARYTFDGSAKKRFSLGMFYRFGVPAGYNGYTDFIQIGLQNGGVWIQGNTTGGPNRAFSRVETVIGGVTTYGGEIVITTGKTYWITILYDDSLNYLYEAVYDPDNGYQKIGQSQAKTNDAADSALYVEFGKGNPNNEYDTSSYFDDILIDYTHAYWPLLPDTTPEGPTITDQPDNVTAILGNTAQFAVGATGTGTLAYQWYQGANTLSGATGLSYTTPSTTGGMSGYKYACTVTDDNGSTTSDTAVLTVITPPTITVEPAKVHRLAGETATYSVTITGSTSTYQWYEDGEPVGSNQNSYTTSALALSDSGQIVRVIVFNVAGADTSESIPIVVKAVPTITVAPEPTTVNDFAAWSFDVTGGRTASYAWYKGATLVGSTSTITGTAAYADSGAEFTCRLTNDTGTIITDPVILHVTPIKPVITGNPANSKRKAGQTATFRSVSYGSGVITYQWQVGGADIEGATLVNYTTGSLAAEDSGNIYRCIHANTWGSDTTTGATLRIVKGFFNSVVKRFFGNANTF